MINPVFVEPFDFSTELVLQRATLACVAVEDNRGAHVTVQAFAWSAGRLWLLAPTESHKVWALRKQPQIAVTVRFGDHAVIMGGTAELVDVWPPDPQQLFGRLPLSMGWYLARNAGITAGIITDLVTGDLPGLSSRTIICVTPARSITLQAGHITHTTGAWADSTEASGAAPTTLDPYTDLFPAPQQSLVRSATTADLGWVGSEGLLCLPAVVSHGLVSVPQSLVDTVGTSVGGGAITVHQSLGNRPSRYLGAMFRGPVGLSIDGNVAIDVERITWWTGYASGTVPIPPTPKAAKRTARTTAKS